MPFFILQNIHRWKGKNYKGKRVGSNTPSTLHPFALLPEKVSTQADHRILGCVQTDITLERAVLAAVVGRS